MGRNTRSITKAPSGGALICTSYRELSVDFCLRPGTRSFKLAICRSRAAQFSGCPEGARFPEPNNHAISFAIVDKLEADGAEQVSTVLRCTLASVLEQTVKRTVVNSFFFQYSTRRESE